jgi:hypothetical protein
MNDNEPINANINQNISYNKTNNTNNKIDRLLLEEQMKCPMCNTIYDSNQHIPFVIGCGHSFCKQCILNNSNSKCPLDNNINAFKMHIRNIQLETIINKVLNDNNKDIQNKKLVYVKPDLKRNKNSENNIININSNNTDFSSKIRGKSINQNIRSGTYKISSPENNGKINYNKKSPSDYFRSSAANNLVKRNRIDDNDILVYSKKDNLINYNLIDNNKKNNSFENDKNLIDIEDNYDFKLEDEKIDDMIINETIGTIPFNEEKSFTNLSIREDFNDLLLAKNEIYKKRIIVNNNNLDKSPFKNKILHENKNINIINDENKIILLEESNTNSNNLNNFNMQKQLRLSNYNLVKRTEKREIYMNDTRQLTESNHNTEKKIKENRTFQNFFNNANINKNKINTNLSHINDSNNNNNKKVRTIFDYIQSISNKLSVANNINGMHKNRNSIKEYTEDLSNKNNLIQTSSKKNDRNDSIEKSNNRINKNNRININSLNKYNYRISLQENKISNDNDNDNENENDNDGNNNNLNILNPKTLKNNGSFGEMRSCRKYIRVRASSKISRKK